MDQICILPGDVADPSILEENGVYYLTCSTFCYAPGLIIHKSVNLIDWDKICYAIPESFGDIWAPDLVRSNDKYYIYFPSKGTIWVTWSNDPEQGWSEPVDLNVRGFIDPGHIADVLTGERYLFFNNGYAAKLSYDGLSVQGDLQKVYHEWPIPAEWDIEGVCLESPKLFYRYPYYYLTVAEGGTAGPPTSHMAVSFRSRKLLSGWEASPYNPILHTADDSEQWWSVGHATLFEDNEKNPYLIYHGYKKHNRNMGRQTLLCKAEWTHDGWFRAIDSNLPEVSEFPDFVDRFSDDPLSLEWSFFKNHDLSRIETGNGLNIKTSGLVLSDSSPLMLNNRWADCELITKVFVPRGAEGGLTFFYNEDANIGLCLNDEGVFVIIRGTYIKTDIRFSGELYLKIRKSKNVVSFYYSMDGIEYTKSPASFDVSFYEHNVFGSFLALRPGIYSAKSGVVRFSEVVYRKYVKSL